MYAQELFGHIEGMLNRDLRTTKTLCTSVRTQNQCRDSTLVECRDVGVSHVFPRKNKRFQQRRNFYAWNSSQRFKHILIIGIYFLSIFNLPTTSARPMDPMQKEWWIHPTDMGNTNSTSKCQIVKLMCEMAKLVRNQANAYLNSHLLPIPGQVTWNVPEFFPIKGGDEVDSNQFKDIDINEFAKNIYNDLQKYALGLDIMYRYQAATTDTVVSNTVDKTESLMIYLRNLLFEINDYFNAFNIIKQDDIRETDFTMEMDVSNFTKFSNVLIVEFVNNVAYVQAGLSYYNETECN